MLCELGPWKIQFCPTASFSDRRDSKFHHRQYPKSQGRQSASTVVYIQFSFSPPLGSVCHQTKSPTGRRDFIQTQSPSLPRSLPPSHQFLRPSSITNLSIWKKSSCSWVWISSRVAFSTPGQYWSASSKVIFAEALNKKHPEQKWHVFSCPDHFNRWPCPLSRHDLPKNTVTQITKV